MLQWNLGLGRRAETRGLVVPEPETGEPVVKYKGSYALLIGSADYQNAAWPDLVSAPGALALQEQGFTVDQISSYVSCHYSIETQKACSVC